MRTNLHGTINVLEAARRAPGRPKVVYASAGATLGAGAPTDWVSSQDVVGDFSRATPHTTYGATKACGELLLADYSRRGFLDGRGLRLPRARRQAKSRSRPVPAIVSSMKVRSLSERAA